MNWTPAEFARIVADHGEVLYRVAYRMIGDASEAEDVVQETLRSAWESRANYVPAPTRAVGADDAARTVDVPLRGWLLAILRRRAADRWRQRWRVVRHEEPWENVASPAAPSDDGYSDEMQWALGQLTPEMREAVLLVVVGELTHQEAATVLGVPIGTVLSRVSRGRAQLRSHLMAERR